MLSEMAGGLVGWRRNQVPGGTVLTLQVATSTQAFHDDDYTRVYLALNDRQLRSLARDLYRATEAKGIPLFAPRRWWRLWSRRLTN